MKIRLILPGFCIVIFALIFSPSDDASFSRAKVATEKANVNLPDVEERIRRVENNLLLPVVVKREPGVPMKLADRIRSANTPGVSVAVINGGRVEWAKGYGVPDIHRRKPDYRASQSFPAISIEQFN